MIDTALMKLSDWSRAHSDDGDTSIKVQKTSPKCGSSHFPGTIPWPSLFPFPSCGYTSVIQLSTIEFRSQITSPATSAILPVPSFAGFRLVVVHRATQWWWRSSSLDSVALETRFCPIGTAIPVSRSSHSLRMSEFRSVFIPRYWREKERAVREGGTEDTLDTAGARNFNSFPSYFLCSL